MVSKIMRLMRFLRITDEQNNLSLTNIALVVAAFNLVQRPEVTTIDVAGLVATLIGYQFKRTAMPAPQDADSVEEMRKAFQSLETKVTALQLGQSYRKK